MDRIAKVTGRAKYAAEIPSAEPGARLFGFKRRRPQPAFLDEEDESATRSAGRGK